MSEFPREAWQRLGRAVYRARRQRPEYRHTQDWADALQRSSRIVLGLERGEKVGKETLVRIEDLLEWEPDQTFAILRGDSPLDEPAENVSTNPDTPPDDTIMFRRPEGMSESEWEVRRASLSGYWRALLDDVARER